MGVGRVGKCPFSPLEIGIKKQIFPENPQVGILNPINWFDSYNDSFFAGMKFILYTSQVHSYSVMKWWACNSLMSLSLPAEAGCEVASGLFCSWSLLRNNTVATNPQRFTLYYGSRCFIAWDWLLNADILASNAARQWHADSGKPCTFVLCEKKHE